MQADAGNAHALYVRTDATKATGLGHFVRCFAIAQAWRDGGDPVTFIGRYEAKLGALLDEEGIARIDVARPHPDPVDLATTLGRVPQGVPVVLDGYGFDREFQERLASGRRLLVIDDFGHQDGYAGFALLNPNLDAASVEYPAAPRRRLLGVRYAPLRRAFRERTVRDARVPARRPTPRLVLVSFGGADTDNHTLRVLRTLTVLPAPPPTIRAVVGPLNPNVAALETFAREHEAVELVPSPRDMLEELRGADLVIASAGSISIELAALGVPAVLLAVADNQRNVGPAMERAGTAVFGGDLRVLGDAALVEILDKTLRDASSLTAMRECGPALVDGRGALRVCTVLKDKNER
jgi:UDP-2,4-diacetamido-2,4,6-trideoxy-beta-L-altropyranose hydrolase